MAAAINSFRLQLRRTLSLSSAIISRTRLRQALPDSPSRPPSTIFSSSTRRTFHSSRYFNGFDKIEPNTILFQGCDYKHWLILMDFGKDPNRRPPPHHMVDTYVQTCAKVFGSVEEAKRRIYACSTTAYTGFQVEVDEDTSKKFETLPGVTFVLPDTYVDPVNKEYGGDKYINGEIIPRAPYVQYGRNFRVDNQGPRDSMPQQGYPPYKQHSSMPPETRSYKPQVPQQGFLQHQNSLAQENYQPVQYYGRTGQTDRVAPIPSGPHNPGVGRVVYQGGQRNFAPPQGNFNHDYSHGQGWMNNHPGNYGGYASSGQYRSESGDYRCNHPQCQRGNFREDHSVYALPGQTGFPGGNRSNSPHPITGGYEQTGARSFEQSGNGQYGQGPTGNYGHRPGYGPHGDRYQSGQSDRVASMSSGPQNPGVGRDGYQDYDYSHRPGNHAAYAPSGQYHSHSGDYGYNHPQRHRGYFPGDYGGYAPLGKMEFPGGNRRNSQPPIAGGYEPTGAGYFEESVNRRYGQGAYEHQYRSDSGDYGYNHPQRQRGNVPGDHAGYAPLGQMEFLGGNWSNSKPPMAGGYEQTGAGYFEQSGNRLYAQGEYEHQYRGDSGDYGYNHPQRQRGYFPGDHGGYAPHGQMGFSGGNRSNSPPPITGGYGQAGAGSFEQSGNGQGPNGNYGHRPGYGHHGESQRLRPTSNEQKNHSDSGEYEHNHPQCQNVNFLGDHGGYAPPGQMGLLGGNSSTSPPLITGVYEQAGAGSIEQSGNGQYGLGANEHQYRIDSGDSRYNHPQHHKDNFPGDRQMGFAGVSRSNSPRPITGGYEQTGAGSFEQSGNRQYGQGPSEIYGDRPGYGPHGESQRLPPTSNDQKNPIEHRNYPPETGLNKGLAALRKVEMDSMDKDLGENYGHRPGDGSHGESQMLRPTSDEQNQGLDPSSKVEMDNMDKDIGENCGHRPEYGPYAESQRLPPTSNEQNQGQDPLSSVKMDNMDKDLVENCGHRPGYGPQAESQRLPPTSDEQNQRGIKMRRAIANFLRRNEHKPPPNRRGCAGHDDMPSSEERKEMMA